MPMTLITGTPGAGKTLFTISRWKGIAEREGRQVYYAGINGLTLPWQEWPVEKWQELPPTAIFIIDEAWRHLKLQGRGQMPEWFGELATHRHGGIDIVLICQNPMQLDPFARRLCDHHFHVSRKFGLQRALVHEFPTGVQDNVAKVRKGSIRHDWAYPKAAYAYYKSAEVHTIKARLPAKVWLLLACFVGFLGMAPFAYKSITTPHIGAAKATTFYSDGSAPGAAGPGASAPMRSARLSPADYAAGYQPRIAGLPHTAPVYDNVTQPVEAPYPAACLASSTRCQCYSQQGTRLEMEDTMCRHLADGGFFVAWRPNGERVQRQAEPPRPRDRLQLDGGGGGMGSFGPSSPQVIAQAQESDAPRPRVRRSTQ